MIETTINVPFKAHLETDSNYYGYVDSPLLSASTYAKAPKARKDLQSAISKQIEEALLTVKNYQTRAIGCVDGTVFIVRFHYSWCYSIVGPSRDYAGTSCGRKTFDETLADARKHAGSERWDCMGIQFLT